MAKAGQHHNNARDQSKPGGHERSKGPNNPSKSEPITAGTYKKSETYAEQHRMHRPTAKQAQRSVREWNEDLRDEPSIAGSTRARRTRSGRSGSDSNASSATRGH
ncbi:MAG: hypothetical protein IRZ14_15800 [Chloroflexi bacterium]|nr:hypothetical protein [Chloroflexota bacterium]